MTRWVAAALLTGVWLLPAPVAAQQARFPSEAAVDVFRAGPDTYAPRYDQPSGLAPVRHPIVRHPILGGYLPIVNGVIVRSPARREPVTRRAAPRMERHRRAAPERSATPPASAPEPRHAPAVPKAFYVIPGCYAGDRPPRPEHLSPECRVGDLRTLPPQP